MQEVTTAPAYTLDHVQLAMPAGREAGARAFYVEVLGFVERPKPPELAARGGAYFVNGPVVLHLGVETPFAAARKAHPALRCAAYDALRARLLEGGFAVTDDPLPFEGKAHCYLADPFGNRIELIAS